MICLMTACIWEGEQKKKKELDKSINFQHNWFENKKGGR